MEENIKLKEELEYMYTEVAEREVNLTKLYIGTLGMTGIAGSIAIASALGMPNNPELIKNGIIGGVSTVLGAILSSQLSKANNNAWEEMLTIGKTIQKINEEKGEGGIRR